MFIEIRRKLSDSIERSISVANCRISASKPFVFLIEMFVKFMKKAQFYVCKHVACLNVHYHGRNYRNPLSIALKFYKKT